MANALAASTPALVRFMNLVVGALEDQMRTVCDMNRQDGKPYPVSHRTHLRLSIGERFSDWQSSHILIWPTAR